MGHTTSELYEILRDQSRELERTKRARTHAQVLLFDSLFPVPEAPATELEDAKAKAVYYKVQLDLATKHRDSLKVEVEKLKTELNDLVRARVWDKARETSTTKEGVQP
jgi:hypothetical protein